MTRWGIHGLPALPCLACLLALLCVPAAARGSPAVAEGEHRCVVLDHEQWQRGEGAAAGKVAAELNVGEPRTVRMIYFLPSDRPFHQEVVDTMKARMRRLQTWFGEQMAAHGYGAMTFRYEADLSAGQAGADGEPVVHRLDGAHPDRCYHDGKSTTVEKEVRQAYDPDDVVLFMVIDNRAGDRIGGGAGRRVGGTASGSKDGGAVFVPGGFAFWVAANELAHAFEMLWHDSRDHAPPWSCCRPCGMLRDRKALPSDSSLKRRTACLS